jgi:hypothetical protein
MDFMIVEHGLFILSRLNGMGGCKKQHHWKCMEFWREKRWLPCCAYVRARKGWVEPSAFCLGNRRSIHWATGAIWSENTHYLICFVVLWTRPCTGARCSFKLSPYVQVTARCCFRTSTSHGNTRAGNVSVKQLWTTASALSSTCIVLVSLTNGKKWMSYDFKEWRVLPFS